MGDWILRAVAGLMAVFLLAAFLAAVLGIDPEYQSRPAGESSGEGYGDPAYPPWSADESSRDADEESPGIFRVLLAGFLCDCIPLAWIALRGLQGRKSRLMLWAVLLHLVIGAILLPGLLLDYEEGEINTIALVLPLQLLWIVYYLAVLGSCYFRDLLPSREYGSR